MKKPNLIIIEGTKNGVITEFRIPLHPQTDCHISRAAAFQAVEALSDIGYSCRIIDFVTTMNNNYGEDSYPHIETDMHNWHIWNAIRYILNQ
jgi:hypothetical protein